MPSLMSDKPLVASFFCVFERYKPTEIESKRKKILIKVPGIWLSIMPDQYIDILTRIQARAKSNPVFTVIRILFLAVHCQQELFVRKRRAHSFLHEFHGLNRVHIGNELADQPNAAKYIFVDQQIFAACTG